GTIHGGVLNIVGIGTPYNSIVPYTVIIPFEKLPFQTVVSNLPAGLYTASWKSSNHDGEYLQSQSLSFVVRAANDSLQRASSYVNGPQLAELTGLTLDKDESAKLPADVTGSAWWSWVASVDGLAEVFGNGRYAVAEGDSVSSLAVQ